MHQPAASPGAHQAGSSGYRRVTAALYGAGLASFAAMYCTQALLPVLVDVLPDRACHRGAHDLADHGNACAVDHSGERAVRALRAHHRDADVGECCPVSSGCCCRSVRRWACCWSAGPCRAWRWPGYPRWRWRIWPRKCTPLRSARRWDATSPGPRWVAGGADHPVPGRRGQRLADRAAGVLVDHAGRHGGIRRTGAAVSVLHARRRQASGSPRIALPFASAKSGAVEAFCLGLRADGRIRHRVQLPRLPVERRSRSRWRRPSSVCCSCCIWWGRSRRSSRDGSPTAGDARWCWAPPCRLTVVGLLVTSRKHSPVVVVGTGVFTGGFFAAHTVASGWVGAVARQDRAEASSLYLFSYYLGGSVAGGLGGVVYSVGGWPGTVAFVGALLLAALFLVALLVKEPAAGRICAVA